MERFFDIAPIHKSLGLRKSAALLGLHALSGSDVTGSFSDRTSLSWKTFNAVNHDLPEALEKLGTTLFANCLPWWLFIKKAISRWKSSNYKSCSKFCSVKSSSSGTWVESRYETKPSQSYPHHSASDGYHAPVSCMDYNVWRSRTMWQLKDTEDVHECNELDIEWRRELWWRM